MKVADIGRGSKLVGFALAIVWIASLAERRRMRQPEAFQKALFLYVVWTGITFFWSIDTSNSVSGFLTNAQLFVLALIVWDLFDSRRAVESALQAYVLGAFVTCGSIIVNYLQAPPARFPLHERINALGFETDGIALIVATAGPAAWYLATGPTSGQRARLFRAINYAYLPVGMYALILTGTRGATLASIPTVLFILWSLLRVSNTTRALAAGFVIAAVVTLVGFTPRGQLDRLSTSVTATELGQQGGALSGRWSIWSASVHAFLGRPIGGVGLDAHRAAVTAQLGETRTFRKSEKEAHNAYLSVLTETGIVGFALFLNVLFRVFARVRRLRGWDLWFWSAQLGVLAIDAFSLSIEDRKAVWLLLALAVSYAAAPQTVPATELSLRLARYPRLAGASPLEAHR